MFLTRRSTLQNSDSFFSGLVAIDDNESEYFIDRDPTHFRHILNFVRGNVTVPSSSAELDELLQEADFYSLHKFVPHIKRQKMSMEKTSIEHNLSIIASKIG